MPSGYPGLDASQMIFGGFMILILIIFAGWGISVSRRMSRIEKDLRDFHELEPEGYDEGEGTDMISEAARMEADAEAARQRDILKRSRHAEGKSSPV